MLNGLAAVRPAIVAAVAVAAYAATWACSGAREPIVLRDGMVVLENQTTREWRDVRVTINDHFTGGVPSLLPGGLLNAPLRDFETGFGQRFDRSRMNVYKIRVSASDADGQPVALSWGR
jgi:hypothetical protein